MRASWQFWSLLSAVFAALTALCAKVGARDVSADLATFWRTVVVLVLLAAILTATGSWRPPAAVSAYTYIALIASGLATGASWFCYFRALKLGDASRVAPIDKLSVAFTAVLAAVFLGERPTMLGWLGICLITGGAVLTALAR